MNGIELDADGFVDMDQYPDDGTDVAGADLDQLREVLHADPVDEPTAEEWDAMFDDVVASDDTGPFALDDVEGLAVDGDDVSSTPDGDVVVDADDAADADDDAAIDDDLADPADDPAVDTTEADAGDLADTADDLDLDLPDDLDGGLDLAPDADVDLTPDTVDDGPADIANNDFEDLL